MSILSLPKMVFSNRGWPELEQRHAALGKFLALVVVPLALLPPALLYYAGSSHGDLFYPGFGSRPWGEIAVVFFLAEMATLLIMGWLIWRTAQWYDLRVTLSDAVRLAGIAPIPMWLSSFSLLIPNLLAVVGIAVLALVASCGLLFNGIRQFCHTRDEVPLGRITQTVISAGVLFWVLLLAIVVSW